MSDAIVALHGWNSSTRGWNEGAWNSEVALPGATGSVGASTVTADANVSVTEARTNVHGRHETDKEHE